MENKKFLLVLRYIILTLMVLGIILYKKDNVDIYAVIVVLVFIINNQLRFFLLSEKKFLVVVSIASECALSYFSYNTYGGIVLFYFLSAALDGAILLKGYFTYIINGLILITMIILSRNLSINEIVSATSAVLTLSVLSIYIKDEQDRRRKVQELYDKLRMSENSLRKANSDLETYSKSVEELTLLRERNRISRELHDSVGHSLSTIIIQLGAIEKLARQNGSTVAEIAGNLRDYAKSSLQEVRTAVHELKPGEFQRYEGILAVEEMIKNFTKLTGVDVKLGFSKEKWALDTNQTFVIYRVIQEFLSNSIRHGKATKVNVFMNFSTDKLIITLKDNGTGADEVQIGIGLTSIWERVKELGGTAEYNSRSGEGFLLKVILRNKKQLDIDHMNKK